MSRSRAALTLVLVTFLWSLAGVVTRRLEAAPSFEITFWRSLFNAGALSLYLGATSGPRHVVLGLARGSRTLYLSGLAWGVMYTAFLVALTLTSVAHVLVTVALEPLLAAFLARLTLGHRLPRRTGFAIALAMLGLVWMFAHDLGALGRREALGLAIAWLVPLAAAANWTLMQGEARAERAQRADLRLAVLVGALFSALGTLPFALPFQASAHDLAWLAFLGVFQLAVPCLLLVAAARVLSAPEVALLSLLEVVFGVAWVWLGAGEAPSAPTLVGGALVVVALAGNELLGLERAPRPTSAAS